MVVHIDGQFHSLGSGVLRDWKLLGNSHIRAHNCFSYLVQISKVPSLRDSFSFFLFTRHFRAGLSHAALSGYLVVAK
jgi:hypothetical protein